MCIRDSVVAVDVAKRSGTNLLLLNDKVNDIISKVKTQIPKDIDIIIVNNQSKIFILNINLNLQEKKF